ncbi:MAG TPA: Clp protease N-terminal domain-containing protein [bacterium]|nr:Clp protease N-terminal domain-containing protein [bacterium]
MFERFTQGARHAITAAQEAARRLGSQSVRPQHILLGLASEPQRVAGRVLSHFGVTFDAVRTRIESLADPTDRPVRGEIGFAPESKTVLKLALDEARRLGHNYIGTEHLLLAMFHVSDAPLPELLQHFGLQMKPVQDLIPQELGEFEPYQGGRPKRRRAALSLLAGEENRNNVVMCRVGDPDLEAIDTLIEAGVRATRSDAAAWLIHAGIEGNKSLFARLQATVGEIRRLREHAQSISREVGLGESPPPPTN